MPNLIKILSISGSPVQQSSTDIILGHLAQSIFNTMQGQQQAEVSFVKLNSLSFRPCQACGVAPTPKWCFYDDLADVFTLLENCDCLLFGSPVYFDSVSAQAKMFIDRCNCFRPANFSGKNPDRKFIRLLTRKRPGAMVLVGGENGWFEGARRVVAGLFKWVEVTNEGLITCASPSFYDSGAARDDAETLKKTGALGKHLAEILLGKSEP
jgi:multimeric flavodoxin WrbA